MTLMEKSGFYLASRVLFISRKVIIISARLWYEELSLTDSNKVGNYLGWMHCGNYFISLLVLYSRT